MDKQNAYGGPYYYKRYLPEFSKEIQYFLEHLDDEDSRVAFIDMMHGHIGNEIYKENNDA